MLSHLCVLLIPRATPPVHHKKKFRSFVAYSTNTVIRILSFSSPLHLKAALCWGGGELHADIVVLSEHKLISVPSLSFHHLITYTDMLHLLPSAVAHYCYGQDSAATVKTLLHRNRQAALPVSSWLIAWLILWHIPLKHRQSAFKRLRTVSSLKTETRNQQEQEMSSALSSLLGSLQPWGGSLKHYSPNEPVLLVSPDYSMTSFQLKLLREKHWPFVSLTLPMRMQTHKQWRLVLMVTRGPELKHMHGRNHSTAFSWFMPVTESEARKQLDCVKDIMANKSIKQR
jgi:hypothetical protein